MKIDYETLKPSDLEEGEVKIKFSKNLIFKVVDTSKKKERIKKWKK